MTSNEFKLIKDIYDFLAETNFYLLKKNVIEIQNNNLELPFKVTLKQNTFLKNLSSLCFYQGYPFGLLNCKAEKDKEKELLLKHKKALKQNINLTLQETKNKDVKKILEIFLTSL